jgi:hypothetical protein
MMRSPWWIFPTLLAACGIAPRADFQALVAAVSQARLEAHLHALCALGPRPESNRAATEATLAYLETELKSYGYEPRREPFDAIMQEWRETTAADGTKTLRMTSRRGVKHHNLIVDKLGQGADAATVCELGAHYDSVPFGPGADDNGSGVAAVLETARLLAPVATDKSIRFVFYAMEEEGLVGSKAHVQELVRQQQVPEAALVLDMVGFASDAEDSQQAPVRIPLLASMPYTGNFIVDAGNFSSGWLGNLFEACVDGYVPELPYFSANRIAGWFAASARSDHASYWAAGIDAILLSDTAEMRNPNYHQATDVPATVDAVFLRRNAQAVLATMLHWAQSVEEPRTARERLATASGQLLLRFEGRELVEGLLQGGGLELDAQTLCVREHGLRLGHEEVRGVPLRADRDCNVVRSIADRHLHAPLFDIDVAARHRHQVVAVAVVPHGPVIRLAQVARCEPRLQRRLLWQFRHSIEHDLHGRPRIQLHVRG